MMTVFLVAAMSGPRRGGPRIRLFCWASSRRHRSGTYSGGEKPSEKKAYRGTLNFPLMMLPPPPHPTSRWR